MYSFIQLNRVLWECYGNTTKRYYKNISTEIIQVQFVNSFFFYLFLFSFRNGSIVRDIFKRSEANNDWNNFSELLKSTPRGNYGNMALHFVQKEIIPNVKGSLRWNKHSDLSTPESAKGVVK